MKTLSSIIFLIQPNTYMTKVDTKKAYQSYMSIKKFQSSRIIVFSINSQHSLMAVQRGNKEVEKNNTKTIFVKIQKK